MAKKFKSLVELVADAQYIISRHDVEPLYGIETWSITPVAIAVLLEI